MDVLPARNHSSVRKFDWLGNFGHLKGKRWTWSIEEEFILNNESSFCLYMYSTDGHYYVWHLPDEEFSPECTEATVKHGGKSVMIWGCITWHGVGTLIFIDGTVNSSKYIEILHDGFLPTACDHFGSADQCILQDDNAPVHRALKVTQWKDRKKIVSLPWVIESSDLNPIEHIRETIDRSIRQRSPYPKTMEKLKAAIGEEWERIIVHTVQNLIVSMPKRIECVVGKGVFDKILGLPLIARVVFF